MSAVASSSATQLYGLASGLDWSSIVNNLLSIERTPETLLNQQSATASRQINAFNSIGSKLTTLTNDLKNLSDPNFFGSRTATSSVPAYASATADTGTANGTYAFSVSQLATASVQNGTTSVSRTIAPTSDVSGVVLSSAGFNSPISAGTFTVNGQIITVATSDTLQGVFDKISTATGGTVAGSYDPAADKISLTSTSGSIVLGSSNDSSNFIQAAGLYNNGTGTVTSVSKVGGINQSATLASANFATTVSDGGSGAGSFLVNGVSISFNASKDSVNDVIQRINDSTAGVTASYDTLNNRFILTNKTQGDVGVSLSDVTGNFLAAIGLSGGTLQRGNNLQYTINGGATLTSRSNTIDSTSSGLKGLSVNVLQQGSFNITVGTDTSTISSAISTFVNDYNSVQNYIASQTATSTDSTGNVTAGTLTGNLDAEGLVSTLRSLVTATPVSGAVSNFDSIGIASNGNDSTLTLSDPTTLNAALTNNLESIKKLFTDSATGIATTLNKYVAAYNGTDGTVATNVASYGKRVTDIKNTIAQMEVKIALDKDRITNEWVQYENVASSTSSQKSYLTSYFSSGTSSSG